MLEKIKEAYKIICESVLLKQNDSLTRKLIKEGLYEILRNPEVPVIVVCDETNNTCETVDRNIIIARVIWVEETNSSKYIDLVFGDPNFKIV